MLTHSWVYMGEGGGSSQTFCLQLRVGSIVQRFAGSGRFSQRRVTLPVDNSVPHAPPCTKNTYLTYKNTYLYKEYVPVHRIRTCTQNTYLYKEYVQYLYSVQRIRIPAQRIRTCSKKTCLYKDYVPVQRIRTCTKNTYLYALYTKNTDRGKRK